MKTEVTLYEEALKEAVIAWSVCASVHREFGKGKDALFSTRQADFQRHEQEARDRLKEFLK